MTVAINMPTMTPATSQRISIILFYYSFENMSLFRKDENNEVARIRDEYRSRSRTYFCQVYPLSLKERHVIKIPNA
jgi:hypothetical protein